MSITLLLILQENFWKCVTPMAFLIKISGLIFYRNLAVLQIVDVPGNILKFVSLNGRLFLIIRKSSKGSLWCQSYFEKKIQTLMIWTNFAELQTLYLCESTEFWKILVGDCFWFSVWFAHVFPSKLLCTYACHRGSCKCDLAQG